MINITRVEAYVGADALVRPEQGESERIEWGPMTIATRRLVQLGQNVRGADMSEEWRERAEKHDRQIEALLQAQAGHDVRLAKLEQLVTQIAEGTTRLLHIAELHEHRLDSHDDRLDNLEGQ
jgi:hypothetical protein